MGGVKTKTPQPKNDASGRNNFQTPLYALDLIIPYIPKNVNAILEPSAGQMRLVDHLQRKYGYNVHAQDLYPMRSDCYTKDFLEMNSNELDTAIGKIDCIITNPPFSLKFDFIEKCMDFDLPFALLIPFDMCGFLHDKFKQGLEAIVPNRRIDYLTPNIVQRINDGETLKNVNKINGSNFKKLSEIPSSFIAEDGILYNSIDNVPVSLIKKYSSSDFHSFWITYKFNQPKQFTFVELSLESKKNVV